VTALDTRVAARMLDGMLTEVEAEHLKMMTPTLPEPFVRAYDAVFRSLLRPFEKCSSAVCWSASWRPKRTCDCPM
jgi:hypothetical protein